jgi:hypothetical protein
MTSSGLAIVTGLGVAAVLADFATVLFAAAFFGADFFGAVFSFAAFPVLAALPTFFVAFVVRLPAVLLAAFLPVLALPVFAFPVFAFPVLVLAGFFAADVAEPRAVLALRFEVFPDFFFAAFLAACLAVFFAAFLASLATTNSL